MKRALWILVGLAAALVLVPFGIANRHLVGLTLDPVRRLDSPFAIDVPLSALLFAAFMGGLLIGAFAMWLRQSKWRQSARLRTREAYHWKTEAARLTRERDAGAEKSLGAPTRRAA